MRVDDVVYGPVDLAEPVLLDLLASSAVQRLHGVLQHGITAVVGVTKPTTRFEHSLGAMLLVRRLGAGLREQIAALLHDVSHTAFSHVIDYVFGGHDSQGYHEEHKEQFVARSDLPAVLGRHGYDWRELIREEDFPLLEQPAPALCADRLDYFLRDSLEFHLSTPERIQEILDHLTVWHQRIVVDDLDVARWLARTYIACDQASWANFREVGLYEVTAQAIRTALRLGAISEADFWGTDEELWARLHRSADAELRRQLALVSAGTQFIWDDAAPTFRVSTKVRTIDPAVLLDGQARPLSDLDSQFAAYRQEYLESKRGLWPMRVVPPPVAPHAWL
jgi:HD superfamily phosphohydrolase